MKSIVNQARHLGPALAAVAIVLGCVADVHGYQRQRQRLPQQPTNIDSSPMIDDLNKALKALNATDRDYDGHRQKAITHIQAAIRDMQVPNAKGQSSTPVADKPPARTATTPQAASDVSVRKALKVLYAVHHTLDDKGSTRGRIHADAQVRIAIQELVQGLKTSTPAATPAPAPAHFSHSRLLSRSRHRQAMTFIGNLRT